MPDYYQILSVVIGSMKCDAKCAGCIAKMTTDPKQYSLFNITDVDWDNFDIVANKAIAGQAKGVLFTGKGEPTLYPEQLNSYLKFLENRDYRFLTIKELQTNGLNLQKKEFKDKWLPTWREYGLRVMALSLVSIDDKINKEYFTPARPNYPALDRTIELLHDEAYKIRLSVILTKDRVDTPEEIDRIVDYCKRNDIHELSIRPMRKTGTMPLHNQGKKAWKWVEANEISMEKENELTKYIIDQKLEVLEYLAHGAVVYNYKNQNLCITDCITHNPNADKEDGHRQIIFYSNGMIMHDWTHSNYCLLPMGKNAVNFLKSKTKV